MQPQNQGDRPEDAVFPSVPYDDQIEMDTDPLNGQAQQVGLLNEGFDAASGRVEQIHIQPSAYLPHEGLLDAGLPPGAEHAPLVAGQPAAQPTAAAFAQPTPSEAQPVPDQQQLRRLERQADQDEVADQQLGGDNQTFTTEGRMTDKWSMGEVDEGRAQTDIAPDQWQSAESLEARRAEQWGEQQSEDLNQLNQSPS